VSARRSPPAAPSPIRSMVLSAGLPNTSCNALPGACGAGATTSAPRATGR
jgi:hypothetical protein